MTRPRRRRARRRRALLYGLLAAFLALFVLSAVRIATGHGDAVKGAWALDGSTIYEFDGRGRGTLKLPLNTYAFSYTVRGGTLTLDFTDPAVADTAYGYAVKDDTLTLDNDGTVFTLVKRK